MRKQNIESGRSMVEMLGVLAVIGVLSVGGIAGYRQAMARHKANEIVNQYNLFLTELVAYRETLSSDIRKVDVESGDFEAHTSVQPTGEIYSLSFSMHNQTEESCKKILDLIDLNTTDDRWQYLTNDTLKYLANPWNFALGECVNGSHDVTADELCTPEFFKDNTLCFWFEAV